MLSSSESPPRPLFLSSNQHVIKLGIVQYINEKRWLQLKSRKLGYLLFKLCLIYEHCLFDETKIKNFTDLQFSFVDFCNLSIHKPSLVSWEVPHKIWAQSVQSFTKVYILKLIELFF